MKTRNLILVVALAAFSIQGMAQCGDASGPMVDDQPKKTQQNIVEIASSLDDFSTLVAAVKAAGLVDVLMGDGPFTVFAPTNASFAKLPEGTVASLLEPAAKDQLTKILTYHVVAGKFTASAVLKAIEDNGGKFTIKTVAGDNLVASVKEGKVVLTDAKGNDSVVSKTDVMASNGVIHVIDAVVLPN